MRLDLVLIGFGNVARRFVELVAEREAPLRRDHGLTIRIVGAVTRRLGAAYRPEGLSVGALSAAADRGQPFETLHDRTVGSAPSGALELIALASDGRRDEGSAVPVLVETTVLDIVTGQPALDHVRAALAAGVHVVTANKGPIAFAYRELADQAAASGLRLLFEGVVMDGVPVFNLVRETMPVVEVVGFRGVVNSTTNHVLTRMEEGSSLESAVAEMQAAGIAEADASHDLDGWDAVAKTAALMNVLMDARTTPRLVDRTGIRQLTVADIGAARRRGCRIKLVASGRRDGARTVGRVGPVELQDTDPLARLSGTENALVLETDLLGELAVTEISSGLTQTAYALLSDLVTLGRWTSVRPRRTDV